MPTSLQGLNIVYPNPPSSDHTGPDTLTPPPGFPDLSAQLDLWTNLSFASDEPFIPKDRKEPELLPGLDKYQGEGENLSREMPVQTSIDETMLSNSPNSNPNSFDLETFLVGFGIDPFLVPPQSTQLQRTTPVSSSVNETSTNPNPILKTDGQPPNKRVRTRKGSTASQEPAIAPSALQQRAFGSDMGTVSEFSEDHDHDPLTTPLTAAEDKRRRNTAASARFRAKKKEREQALEKRSKELETKVTELERECEGLRRENGWLRGLVVGVTGGNPSNVPSVHGENSGTVVADEQSKVKRKLEQD